MLRAPLDAEVPAESVRLDFRRLTRIQLIQDVDVSDWHVLLIHCVPKRLVLHRIKSLLEIDGRSPKWNLKLFTLRESPPAP